MSTHKIRRATEAEKLAYAATMPVYPLYGYVFKGGLECPVEYVGDRKNGIMYELVIPDGYHTKEDGLHTVLCRNAKEVLWGTTTLEKCNEDCYGI